ncbi:MULTISPECIES: RidA family protein [unclassified Sulfitobacter]|uniref:RidA family protein n=1 Tax=unclassified Sulfitobacter TaxID=196795 RepID=UPI003746CEF4
MIRKFIAPLAAVAALMATSVYAQGSEVVRHGLPDSDFPILQAVEVPADATLVYLSGTVPTVANETAEKGSPEYFGDTATQTASVLASIEKKLAGLNLDMGDVIKMQAYLVAPEGSDGMDFEGFMKGYTQYFGTDEQPELPTRSVFAVAGLANQAWLVEIEVVAVRSGS